MGSGEEADSPHSLYESVLKTIATTTSIALLDPYTCLGMTLCEEDAGEQAKVNHQAKAGDP